MLKSGDRDGGAWRSLAWRSPAGRSSPRGHLPGGHHLEVTCQEVITRRSSPGGHLEAPSAHTEVPQDKIKSKKLQNTPKASGAMKEGVRPQESTSIPMSVCLSVCLGVRTLGDGQEPELRRPRPGLGQRASPVLQWVALSLWRSRLPRPGRGLPLSVDSAEALGGNYRSARRKRLR